MIAGRNEGMLILWKLHLSATNPVINTSSMWKYGKDMAAAYKHGKLLLEKMYPIMKKNKVILLPF